MNKNLIMRKFKTEDTNTIEAIIQEAWHYNDFCSPQIASKLSRVFLSSCLANQTDTRVAVCNGMPVGVIMSKNIKTHRCPMKLRIKQILAIVSLYASAEGRRASKIFECVKEIDDGLLKNCNTNYQGEIAFFAVSSAVRGQGIGKMLFQSMLGSMKCQGIRDFYLFTDTSCNYQFYERQGMNRRGEKKQSFIMKGQEEKMTFYIYDYKI